MTLFEKLLREMSSAIKADVKEDKPFFVDLTSDRKYGDLCTNAPLVYGKNFDLSHISFVSETSEVNGFLNIRLKDSLFFDYLNSFSLSETPAEKMSFLDAYVQLAENEKKYTGLRGKDIILTDEVRRCILCLMKAQYLCGNNSNIAGIVSNEAMSILKKLETESKNLKTFVIDFEPLLLAARGSLAKSD